MKTVFCQNYEEILAAVRSGGNEIVAPRNSGKTRALIEVMKDDPEFVLVAPNERLAHYIKTHFEDVYPRRVIHQGQVFGYFEGKSRNVKILADEMIPFDILGQCPPRYATLFAVVHS